MTRLPIVDAKTMDRILVRLGFAPCGESEAMSSIATLTGAPRLCHIILEETSLVRY
jgi:hypothetical protein